MPAGSLTKPHIRVSQGYWCIKWRIANEKRSKNNPSDRKSIQPREECHDTRY